MKFYLINFFLIILFSGCGAFEKPPEPSATASKKPAAEYYYICDTMSDKEYSKRIYNKGFRVHPSTPKEVKWWNSKPEWDTFASVCVKISIN